MIYLASPYTHDRPAVRQYRVDAARKAVRSLLLQGIDVFSPVVYADGINLQTPLPLPYADWMRLDFTFLKHAEQLWILPLHGWRESSGVSAEIEYALGKNLPVKMLTVSLNGCFLENIMQPAGLLPRIRVAEKPTTDADVVELALEEQPPCRNKMPYS